MDIAEVVLHLTGPVEPVGDSRMDEHRLENLRTLCDVTGVLLDRIALVADVYGDHMASIKAAKDHAARFLASVRTSIGDTPAPQSTEGASNYDTRQFSNLTNQAHGFAPAPLVSGDSEANKEKG